VIDRFRLRLLGAVFAFGSLGAAALAQPTFGRPRETRPRSPADNRPPPGAEALSPADEPWRDTDPPREKFSDKAEPGTTYAWRSTDGLRFAWRLPEGFDPASGVDAVVLLHPRGADFRWGAATFTDVPEAPPGPARTRLIISVDGTAPFAGRPNVRSWEAQEFQALHFRDFLLQMTREFPVQRVFLAGQGEGGAFAVYFAMRFPALADGVVVQSAALFDGEPTGKTNIPLVFVHGSSDSITPLARAFAARSAFEDAGSTSARVRVAPGLNDFANPARIAEGLDYAKGLRSMDEGEVLSAARAILTPKPADEVGYRGPVWFAGAREVLLRLTGTGVEPLEDVAAETRVSAQTLLDRIDAHAEAHLAVLRPVVGPSAALLGPDGGAWLGHLLALREDFRGVPAVEAFIAEIGFDAVQAEHRALAAEFRDRWDPDAGEPGEQFAGAVDAFGGAFLSWTLPLDVGGRCRAWARRAGELKIPPETAAQVEVVENVDKGVRDGLEGYQRLWSRWTPDGD
jgi:predicted esterase